MTGRVVGVDLSLTSTGLADSDGATDRFRSKPAKGGGLLDDLNRIGIIADAVDMFATFGETGSFASLVAVEGPSLGQSRQAGQHTRAGLWWAVARKLVDGGHTVLVVPPAVLKTYATGRGNAGKDEVLAAAVKRYPAHAITGNDVADAVVLAAIGARLSGHPIDGDMPKTHLRALDKLRRP